MGTSASSRGAGSGVPFDPPWLDEIMPAFPGDGMQPTEPGDGQNDEQDDQSDESSETSGKSPAVAPPGRFGNARRSLGNFARTGDEGAFRNAMGHYSRTGMGGATRVAKRMRVSTKSAANLFNVLQAARENTNPVISEWVASLTDMSSSVQNIIDEIIRFVAPDGGSTDEVSCRESMAQAMQDLLAEAPNIDLLDLDDDNIWVLIESFLGYEASNRVYLDIGQTFENPVLTPLEKVLRMNEMQEYLKAELTVQVEKLRQRTSSAVSSDLQKVLETAVKNTFVVYEGSL